MRQFKTYFTTFYSYKGGVGRTSALVNSALLRAIAGDRVVVIDFDMEAPGIWSYVREIAKAKGARIDLESREGILEYFYSAIHSEEVPSLKKFAVSEKDLGLTIDGKIWFIGAGNTSDPSYFKKLSSMNWSEIFEKEYGELLLENLKGQIADEFEGPDHVFVDSRTGITEIGGVCTRYLADLVVTLSSLNDQNIHGTSKIASAFTRAKKPTILVASNVPVGLPWGERQIFTERLRSFRDFFEANPELLIYHYPSLSLTEYLPALFKTITDEAILREDPLLKSYETLAERINGRNPYSFDKFLQQTISKVFGEDSDFQLDLDFVEKFYSNREPVLNFLKSLFFILSAARDEKFNFLKDEFISSMRSIQQFDKQSIPVMNVYREYAWNQGSEAILKTAREKPKSVKQAKSWFPVINEIAKREATELITGEGEYQTMSELFDYLEDRPYYRFLKAYVFDKSNRRKDAMDMFKLFLEDYTRPSSITQFDVVLAAAYASIKLKQKDLAYSYLTRAGVLLESFDLDQGSVLLPTQFVRADKPQELTNEIQRLFDAANAIENK